MNIKNKMIKVVKETADWYAEDPDNRRSIDADGQCMYTWGDSHCAVGRYMKECYQKESFPDNNDSVNELCEHSEDMGSGSGYNIDWCLREEVHGLDPDFWTDLQDLHDSNSYWITKKSVNIADLPIGISPDGVTRYHKIIDKIKNGDYDG